MDFEESFVLARCPAAELSAIDPYRDVLTYFHDLGTAAFDDDLGLYLGLAQRGRGPILELGCGTGRVMLALARAGHDVVGLDRSVDMLRRAHRRLFEADAGMSELVLADAVATPLAGPFDLILMALDGFLHLTEREDQLAMLGEAARLLSRDGLLALDLAGPAAAGWDDWAPGSRPLVVAWHAVAADGSRVVKLSGFSVDAAEQRHLVNEVYELIRADGEVRRWFAEYPLRFVFPFEIELLLERAGLELVDRYGGYDLGPFDAGSARQICIARRARDDQPK